MITDNRSNPIPAANRDQYLSEPQQERSRESMSRVLEAFDTLLKSHPYDRIRISEIAALSGTATSSIYARFKDKKSILLVLHEEISVSAEAYLIGLYPEASGKKEKYIRAVVNSILDGFERWYSKNRNLIHAILVVDDAIVYKRASDVFRAAVSSYQQRFSEYSPHSNVAEVTSAFSMIVSTTSSVLQQQTLFADIGQSYDHRVLERLNDLFCKHLVSLIGEKKPKGRARREDRKEGEAVGAPPRARIRNRS